MSFPATLRSCLVAAVCLLALSLGSTRMAAAQTLTFKDVWQPGGKMRNGAAEKVDVLACGATKSLRVYNLPALQDCMRARGWVLDSFTPDPANSRSAGGGLADEQDIRNFNAAIDAERQLDDQIRHDDPNLSPGCGSC